jgi:NADH pyrophosphatase NudC (nudix superfamily)
MIYESGSEADHDAEMEEVRWVTPEQAIELLAYQGAKNVVARASARIKELVAQERGG